MNIYELYRIALKEKNQAKFQHNLTNRHKFYRRRTKENHFGFAIKSLNTQKPVFLQV